MSPGPVDHNLVSYYLFRLCGAVLPHVPTRIAYPLAAVLGDLYYWLLPGRRVGLADNISHVLAKPPQSPQVRTVVRQVCRNLARNFYDLFRVRHLTNEQIADLVETVGWEYIEVARQSGRGVVLVAPHFGNLDIVMQTAAVRALPTTIPAEHLQPERLFRYIRSLRTSHGLLHLVPVDGPLLEVFRALRRNEAVALAVDRSVTGTGRWTQFFGKPAWLPDGHVRLALRTGAAMIAAFSHRLVDGRFMLHLFRVPLERTGDTDAQVSRGMRALLAIVEEQIRADPGQWVLTVPIWDCTDLNHQHRRERGGKDEDCSDLSL